MLGTYALLAAAAVCCLLYYYFTRTFGYWARRHVRSPKPVPLFGNMLDSAIRRKNIGVLFKEIYEQFPDEKVVGVYRMTTPGLLIRDLDMAKEILIRDFDKFSDRGVSFGEEGLGNNLFHADSDKWRVLRSRFTPMFTSGKLKNMIYLLEQRGDKLVHYIQETFQKEREVYSLFKKYTMATISACAFGLDVETISDKMYIFNKIDNLIFSPSFFEEVDMMFPGILKKLKLEPFPQEISSFFTEMVSTVFKHRDGQPSGRGDFMDLILEMRQKHEIHSKKYTSDKYNCSLELTDSIIAAQALVFYAAGYETSATTMAFMTYELAKHPDIQNKLIAEVDEVLKKYDGKVTFEALNELTYMERVLSETLRLYPLVEPLQRRAQDNYKIPGTDIILKKDQIVLISATGIHNDEKYYPNPQQFDPERFSPENSAGRHVCAYMPFGSGPRNCIGMRFARYQIRVCLIKIFSKFRVEPTENTAPTMKFRPRRFVVSPKGGIHLNFVPR